MMPIVVFVLGPGLPPGNGSVEASGQVVDNTVLLALATPVALAVLVYLGYALWAFRERNPEVVVDGAAIRGNSSLQFWWLVMTTTLVLFLAGYGTRQAAGRRVGRRPGAEPDRRSRQRPRATPPLQVQVIAQQWQFTYRFPATAASRRERSSCRRTRWSVPRHLARRDPLLLGLRAGCQGRRQPRRGQHRVCDDQGTADLPRRCAELCGVWHGYMFNTGQVVPKAQFASWIAQQQQQYAPGDQEPAAVFEDLLPSNPEERRMSAIAASVPAPRTGWRQLMGFNMLTGIVLGIGGWFLGLRHRRPHPRRRRSSTTRTEAGQNDIAIMLGYFLGVVGFLVGLGFANYPLKRLLGHPPSLAEKEAEELRAAALLQPVHRPQGRRQAVHGRDRVVLLRRRAERDADPHRAASAERARVRRQPVPDAGRHARLDDDGDHDLGDPGAVRQLARAADDRLAADGVPADRVVHVLAPDGRRRDPDHDDLLRRLPDRLDRLSAARRPGHRRLRRLHRLLRARRPLDDAVRVQPDRDDRDHARAGHDLVAAADLRLGDVRRPRR